MHNKGYFTIIQNERQIINLTKILQHFLKKIKRKIRKEITNIYMKKEEKSRLRKEIIKKRDELPFPTRQMADTAIAERIIGHQWFYRAEVLLGFVNYGSEISTEEILEEALRKGKKLFLPP